MKTKKALILSMALALSSLNAWATTPGVTFQFTNGQKASFAFASKPKIEVTSNGLSVSYSNAAAVSYLFTDVQRFYFEDDIIDTGISQIGGTAPSNHPVFNYTDGIVTVSGLAAGEYISITTLNGSKVNATIVDTEGDANINIKNVPTGVYIVSTSNGICFKILKK